MKKILILLLLVCLSANSQTKGTLYLDKYELSSPEFCQILKKYVIEQLDDEIFGDIGAKETEKGKEIWVTVAVKEGINNHNINRVKGYLMFEGYRFLIFDDPQYLPVIRVKDAKLKLECKLNEYMLDGAKEWTFLVSDNQWYLTQTTVRSLWESIVVKNDKIIPMNDKTPNTWLKVMNEIFQKYLDLRDKLKKE
ncbi:MAG: hypothetical protein IKX33_08395 [Prevotella sp.]|nr:hypothetical protein [Prevotella sp.]